MMIAPNSHARLKDRGWKVGEEEARYQRIKGQKGTPTSGADVLFGQEFEIVKNRRKYGRR